jgi:hypothetical protein
MRGNTLCRAQHSISCLEVSARSRYHCSMNGTSAVVVRVLPESRDLKGSGLLKVMDCRVQLKSRRRFGQLDASRHSVSEYSRANLLSRL